MPKEKRCPARRYNRFYEGQYRAGAKPHYRIVHEFEVVFLERLRPYGSPVIIGDFYGDPNAAVIDQDERFVIVVGYGLIIYHLREPFEPFHPNIQSTQWKEMLRSSDGGSTVGV